MGFHVMISLFSFYQRADCHRDVLCTASSKEAHTGLHCVRGTGVLFCMCLYHVLYVLAPCLHGPLVPLCLQCNPNPMPLLSTFHNKPHSLMAKDTNQRLMLQPYRLSLISDSRQSVTLKITSHHSANFGIWFLTNTDIAFSEHTVSLYYASVS